MKMKISLLRAPRQPIVNQKIRKTKRHRDSSDTVTGHTKYVMEGAIQNLRFKIFNIIKLRLEETR